MSNNSNEVNLKYEVSYNLRWYQERTPSPDAHDQGVVGHRYVSRNKLAAKLRELHTDESINSISVVEHRSLSDEEIQALMQEGL